MQPAAAVQQPSPSPSPSLEPYRNPDGDEDGSQSDIDATAAAAAGSSKYRILLTSAAQAAALFIFCLVFLILLLKALLPPIDPADSPAVKIPRSFDDLKRLNDVLQIYKDRNFARVLGSWIALYLFLQAYSLPGSMYLSILAGAMYGVPFALPLVCTCVATGATLCYLISALLGPALLLASDKWTTRLEVWREHIRQQRSNMVSYMIVLRMSPLPPHWMVNIAAPHLSISIPLFWISTFFGVMAVSFIHCQIGTTLDQMTSAADFHLISLRNFFGLAGVIVGALVPVAIRHYYGGELQTLAEAGDLAVEVPAGAGQPHTARSGDSGYAPGDHVVVDVVKPGKGADDDDQDKTDGEPNTRTLLVRLPPDTADPHRGGAIRL